MFYQMHLQATGMSWDKFPAAGKSLEDLDFEKVKRYMRKAADTGRKVFSEDESPLQVLEKMELVKDGRPTWAA